MPSWNESTSPTPPTPPSNPPAPPSGPLDLSRYSEHTRRRLYDITAEVHFPDDPEPDEITPEYSPEEAGLTILWAFGRWFAVWRRLEVPLDQPEAHHWEVLRIEESEYNPWGLEYHEVGG